MTDKIISRLIATDCGRHIAIITLNNPKALNAQDLDMVKATKALLDTWADDESVVAVVLHGAGEKGLCAGGDIKGLYYALADDKPELAQEFFEIEYGLMYQMHTYQKPIIAWGHGIVMGGGLGLLAGASHKIITENTVMAMPEVSIGLFPDAGATYFLNRMPNKIGLFLGITGVRITGADAYVLGLADFALPSSDFDKMLNELSSANWQNDDNKNKGIANFILNQLHDDTIVNNPPILKELASINQLMNAGNLADIDKAICEYRGESEFIKSAQAFYVKGSPMTKSITYGLYLKSKQLSLADIFNLELHTANFCCVSGDFKEGVRALLIDKDKNPQWKFSMDDIDDIVLI